MSSFVIVHTLHITSLCKPRQPRHTVYCVSLNLIHRPVKVLKNEGEVHLKMCEIGHIRYEDTSIQLHMYMYKFIVIYSSFSGVPKMIFDILVASLLEVHS